MGNRVLWYNDAMEKVATDIGSFGELRRNAVPHLGWSSNVYPLEVADVAAVPDYVGEPIPSEVLPNDAIVLYIRPDGTDAVLRGRHRLTAALAKGPRTAVSVRIVFKPSVPKWNLAATCIRVFRNRYRYKSSRLYHIAPQTVRDLGLERAIRTRDNVGRGHESRMDPLYTSLRRTGYDETHPINIMLCRTRGHIDSLRQGHHRISACLEIGVPRVTVCFSAAGALPFVGRWFVHVHFPFGRLSRKSHDT